MADPTTPDELARLPVSQVTRATHDPARDANERAWYQRVWACLADPDNPNYRQATADVIDRLLEAYPEVDGRELVAWFAERERRWKQERAE